MSKRMSTKRVALCGLMLAMMLILGWVERVLIQPMMMSIPILNVVFALPGIKLGLANIVSLVALYLLGGKSACARNSGKRPSAGSRNA